MHSHACSVFIFVIPITHIVYQCSFPRTFQREQPRSRLKRFRLPEETKLIAELSPGAEPRLSSRLPCAEIIHRALRHGRRRRVARARRRSVVGRGAAERGGHARLPPSGVGGVLAVGKGPLEAAEEVGDVALGRSVASAKGAEHVHHAAVERGGGAVAEGAARIVRALVAAVGGVDVVERDVAEVDEGRRSGGIGDRREKGVECLCDDVRRLVTKLSRGIAVPLD